MWVTPALDSLAYTSNSLGETIGNCPRGQHHCWKIVMQFPQSVAGLKLWLVRRLEPHTTLLFYSCVLPRATTVVEVSIPNTKHSGLTAAAWFMLQIHTCGRIEESMKPEGLKNLTRPFPHLLPISREVYVSEYIPYQSALCRFGLRIIAATA